jgi:hypothetical protein
MKSATVLLFLAATSVLGQGTFQNLDFESTTVSQSQAPGVVDVTLALPSWSVYIGTNQQSLIRYNDVAIGSTSVDLLGSNAPGTGYASIEGGFSVLLQGGVAGSGPNLYPAAASIRQIGLVPASARSVLFKAQPDNAGSLSVSLGGTSIPYSILSMTPRYNLYGANISAYAGQTLELDFSVSRFSGTAYSNWNLDSIEFSASLIPEPGVLSLFALGTVLLTWPFLRVTRHQPL